MSKQNTYNLDLTREQLLHILCKVYLLPYGSDTFYCLEVEKKDKSFMKEDYDPHETLSEALGVSRDEAKNIAYTFLYSFQESPSLKGLFEDSAAYRSVEDIVNGHVAYYGG